MKFKGWLLVGTLGLNKLSRYFLFITLGFLPSACVTIVMPTDFDNREIVAHTFSLYHQHLDVKSTKKKWKGNWIFRRERLILIDAELRQTRPDLVLFQEVLAKKGSPTDSDMEILSQGGLKGYQWQQNLIDFFEDTGEELFQSIAAGLPLRMNSNSPYYGKVWHFGLNGVATFSLVKTQDQPLAVFNVQMPRDDTGEFLWYNYLSDRILEVLQEISICPQRLIVGGYLPGNMDSPNYTNFIDTLQLKSTGQDSCSVASDCFTGTPQNEIFMQTNANSEPGHYDKILVHRNAKVSSGIVIHNKASQKKFSQKNYGLTQLWPSQRFGWLSSFRLTKCR